MLCFLCGRLNDINSLILSFNTSFLSIDTEAALGIKRCVRQVLCPRDYIK